MASQDLIEVKFRLSDGTDIGPSKYSPTASVASLKEKILSQWPKDREICPKTINDLKLINAGKILENNRTLAESRLPVELPGGVITMHVVVRPPLSDKNAGARFLILSGSAGGLIRRSFTALNPAVSLSTTGPSFLCGSGMRNWTASVVGLASLFTKGVFLVTIWVKDKGKKKIIEDE